MQVKAGSARKEGTAPGLCLSILEHYSQMNSFPVFPHDHSSALRVLLELLLFQGETGLYIDEWTGMSLLSASSNSFFKQINQVRRHWAYSSIGAFPRGGGSLLNIKPPHS